MRIVMVLLFSIFSLSAFANEVVRLKAGMSLLECKYVIEGDDKLVEWCITAVNLKEPRQILLTEDDTHRTLMGEHKFNIRQDGYNFEGTVLVTKFIHNNPARYSVKISVIATKGDNFMKEVYLGEVLVDDMKKLNEISWSAEAARNKDEQLFYVPTVTIDSSK